MAYHPKSSYIDNLEYDLQNSLNNPYQIISNVLVFGDVGTNMYRFYNPITKQITTPTQPPFTVTSGNHIVKTSLGLFAWSQGGRYVSLSTNNGVTWGNSVDYGSDLSSYAIKVVVVKKNGIETMLIGSGDYDANGSLAWATIDVTPVRTTFANPLGGTKACPFRGYNGTPLLVIDGSGGSSGKIARYNGTGWDSSTPEPAGNASSASHITETSVGTYIVSGYGYDGGLNTRIRRSTDFINWSNKIDTIFGTSSRGLFYSPNGTLINVLGDSVASKIRYSQDDGLTWSGATYPASSCSGTNSFVMPIYDPYTMKLYVMSTSEYVLSSNDNGINWAVETQLSSVNINIFSSNFVFPLSKTDVSNSINTVALSAALNNYTLLTTTAAISANLQNQINTLSVWNNISGNNYNLLPNNGYITNNPSAMNLQSPTNSNSGDLTYIIDNNAGGWNLAVSNNQSIYVNDSIIISSGYMLTGTSNSYADIVWLNSNYGRLEDNDNLLMLPTKNITNSTAINLTGGGGTSIQTKDIAWSPLYNKFVIVGDFIDQFSGLSPWYAQTSNGYNYTILGGSISSPVENSVQFNSVCWSSGLNVFCAGGNNHIYVTGQGASTSGSNLGWATYPAYSIVNNSIVWSDTLSLFCSVGSNTIVTSPDGQTWTNRGSGLGLNPKICWSSELSLFCATTDISPSGNQIIKSSNGIDWSYSLNQTNPPVYKDIIWANTLGVFVLICDNGIQSVALSSDGNTWNFVTTPNITTAYSVLWIESLQTLYLFAINGVFVSNNGINWTQISSNPNGIRRAAWSSSLQKMIGVTNTSIVYLT